MAGREIYGARHKGSGPKKERTIPRIAVDMKVKAGGIGDRITMGGHLYQMEKHGPFAMASQSGAMALLRKRVRERDGGPSWKHWAKGGVSGSQTYKEMVSDSMSGWLFVPWPGISGGRCVGSPLSGSQEKRSSESLRHRVRAEGRVVEFHEVGRR